MKRIVLACALLTGNAFAETDVSARIGSGVAGLTMGAAGHYVYSNNLKFGPIIDFGRSTTDVVGYSYTVNQLSVGGEGRYTFDFHPIQDIELFGSGGLSYNRLSYSYEYSAPVPVPLASYSVNGIGIDMGAGTKYKITPKLGAEVGATYRVSSAGGSVVYAAGSYRM